MGLSLFVFLFVCFFNFVLSSGFPRAITSVLTCSAPAPLATPTHTCSPSAVSPSVHAASPPAFGSSGEHCLWQVQRPQGASCASWSSTPRFSVSLCVFAAPPCVGLRFWIWNLRKRRQLFPDIEGFRTLQVNSRNRNLNSSLMWLWVNTRGRRVQTKPESTPVARPADVSGRRTVGSAVSSPRQDVVLGGERARRY